MTRTTAVALLAAMVLSTAANAGPADWLKKRADALKDAVVKGVDNVSEAAQKTAGDVEQQIGETSGLPGSGDVQGLRMQAARMAAECRSRTEFPDPDYDPCVKTCEAVGNYEVDPDNPLAGQLVQGIFSSCQQQHAAVTDSDPGTPDTGKTSAGKPAGQPPGGQSAEFGPHLVIAAPGARYEDVKLPKFKGLPRLGIQDSEGLEIREERNKMSSELVTALNLRKFEIQHNLRYYRLLVGIGLADLLFEGMDPNRMLWGAVTRGAGSPQLSQQEHHWHMGQHLMFVLATYALREDHYGDYFCSAKSASCGKFQPQTGQMIAPNGWGGGFGADEFDTRAAYQAFVKTDYDHLRAWSRGVAREAYFIGRLGLEEYDFDRQAFAVSGQPFPSSGQSWDSVSEIEFQHEPARSELSTGPMGSVRGYFALPAEDAKALLDSLPSSGRSLYTAARIKFVEGGSVRLAQHFVAQFVAASPVVELYKDESLTEYVGSLNLGAQTSN